MLDNTRFPYCIQLVILGAGSVLVFFWQSFCSVAEGRGYPGVGCLPEILLLSMKLWDWSNAVKKSNPKHPEFRNHVLL